MIPCQATCNPLVKFVPPAWPLSYSPNIHILHTHYDVVMFVEKSSVEGDNVVGMAAMHDLEFSYDSFSQLLLRLDVYNLSPAMLVSDFEMRVG